jgi:CRISPR-associated protein Cmr2
MTKHLLLISIGPIQDFIASARRCQDLWFGSWLLSDLAREVAQSVKEQAKNDPLIFPAGLNLADKPSVANKIMAMLGDGADPNDIAETAKKAMDKRLNSLADEAFDPLPEKFFNQALAEKQVADLMEFLWVSVPIGEGEGGYAAVRDRAEALLAARKNTKDWGPVSWHPLAGKGVPKSSLDGVRESVIHEQAYDVLTPNELRLKYLVKPGERLCGVGLLKRAGVDKPGNIGGVARPAFHSTSHVASAPILTRMAMQGDAAENAFDEYRKVLERIGVDLKRFRIRAGKTTHAKVGNPLTNSEDPVKPARAYEVAADGHGYDGYLLFENRLPEIVTEYCTEHAQAASNSSAGAKALTDAKDAHRRFRKALGLREGHTAYYAYLLADGDKMGQAIDALAKGKDGIQAHRKLSKALEDFSGGCARIVEEHGGSLVYAGGDDVLALCPLHTVLSLARALRDSFNDSVAYLSKEKMPSLPTLSVGLSICHHMSSMERARELAKTAEKMAKDAGRNALAIVLEKRSGGVIDAVSKWSNDESCVDRHLVQLAKWLNAGELPHGFAYDLEQMLIPFVTPTTGAQSNSEFGEIILKLAERVLHRKRAEGGEAELSSGLKRYLSSRLRSSDAMKAVTQMANEIQIAREFLRAFEDAGWTSEQKGGVQ